MWVDERDINIGIANTIRDPYFVSCETHHPWIDGLPWVVPPVRPIGSALGQFSRLDPCVTTWTTSPWQCPLLNAEAALLELAARGIDIAAARISNSRLDAVHG